MSTYSEKLKDPRWQRKRLEIFRRDNWECQHCHSKDEQLQVHHKEYTVENPWDEDDKNLITLCEDCHKFKKELKDLFDSVLNSNKQNKPYDLNDLSHIKSFIWNIFADIFDSNKITKPVKYNKEIWSALIEYLNIKISIKKKKK